MVPHVVIVTRVTVMEPELHAAPGETAMWYHPASYALGRRDVIGAWLICLMIAAMLFG